MSEVTPARIGLLVDYLDEQGGFDDNILASLRFVFDEYAEQKIPSGRWSRPDFVMDGVSICPGSPCC
jgi:hypothetical protein